MDHVWSRSVVVILGSMSTEGRTGINWVQVIAAALAAVSSAVVLSTLGVAGTIIGAAVGSLTASIGAAVYSRTIDASRQQVAAQAAALKRVAHARNQVDDAVLAMSRGGARSDTGVLRAQARLSEAEQALADAEGHVERSTDASGPGGGPVDEDHVDSAADDGDATGEDHGDALFNAQAGKRLPWKRVALVAAAIFVVAMIAITGFELLTGRAVSSYTGGSDRSTGSTVPGLGPGSSSHAPTPTPAPSSQPSESGQPSPSESDAPSSSTTPTPTPSPSPTQTPLSSATPTPTPTPSLSVG